MANHLSQKRLRELLHYNPDTGVFTWKVHRAGNAMIGDIAGYLDEDSGYIRITLDYYLHHAHRLVFVYVVGETPEQIDHINHIRNDNRWINLRPANNPLNRLTQTLRIDNSSGFTGVVWFKRYSKWRARITINGKEKHLGYFIEKGDAITARKKANIKYGFHENHGAAK